MVTAATNDLLLGRAPRQDLIGTPRDPHPGVPDPKSATVAITRPLSASIRETPAGFDWMLLKTRGLSMNSQPARPGSYTP